MLLKAWSGGQPEALDQLTVAVYNELRRLARRYMRNERSGNTLQTTALVNEAWLRLVDTKTVVLRQISECIRVQMIARCFRANGYCYPISGGRSGVRSTR